MSYFVNYDTKSDGNSKTCYQIVHVILFKETLMLSFWMSAIPSLHISFQLLHNRIERLSLKRNQNNSQKVILYCQIGAVIKKTKIKIQALKYFLNGEILRHWLLLDFLGVLISIDMYVSTATFSPYDLEPLILVYTFGSSFQIWQDFIVHSYSS